MSDIEQTPPDPPLFDFDAYPKDTFFHERRGGPGKPIAEPADGKARKDRRRRGRVDPTTFEKQYSADEMEFMTAMHQFKQRCNKPFPTYGEVLAEAHKLGYRKVGLPRPIAGLDQLDGGAIED